MNLMEYKGYYGSVEAHPDDDCLFGKIQNIRSLISYEGVTLAELKARFQSAVDDYLAFCEEQKTEPEKPFKGSFNIRPGASLHRKAALAAQELDMSLNEFIREAIAEKVNNSHYQHR